MVGPPPKRYIHIKSLETVNVTLFRERLFAIVTKLRVSRQDHPELYDCTLNPMIRPYKRKIEDNLRQTEEKTDMEER